MGLGWIDDRNGDVSMNEGECKVHPVGTGGLHHDKNGSGIGLERQEMMFEFGKAGGSLVERAGAGRWFSVAQRGKGKGASRHINATKEPIGTRLLEHSTPLQELG